jgi:ribosome maturation factor RimP
VLLAQFADPCIRGCGPAQAEESLFEHMSFAHEKLHGIDRDRLLAVVEPVLCAHGVEGVELVWRTDRGDWVLEVNIELPGSRVPGAGITLDLCTEISRDLSAALDSTDLIPAAYRLEVGSPGLDRALYSAGDYVRFAGQAAKLKLSEPVNGERVIAGIIHGLDDAGCVILDMERGAVSLELGVIQSAHLLFDWKSSAGVKGGGAKGTRQREAGVKSPGRKTQRSK